MHEAEETASEFLARLRQDPQFRKREEDTKEKLRLAKLREDRAFAPILHRLSEAGFEARSIYEVGRRFAPLAPSVVEILLSSIPTFEDDALKEMVIRQLAAAGERFDGTLLAAAYDRATHEGLRFAVLNTIACTMPHSIDDWLRTVRRDPWADKTLSGIGEDMYGEEFVRYLGRCRHEL